MAYSSKARSKPKTFEPDSKDHFKISRTKIDLFLECPLCFYLDARLGVKRPDTYPLTLNIAVDALLKKEFDLHRARGVAHPSMKDFGIDAVPLKHENINLWRELDFGRGGVHYIHPKTGLDVYGVVDDIWINPKKEFLVVDYKATAKSSTPTLDGNLGEQYKRQMEVYQWLLKMNGYPVSSMGYFFYVNGKKDVVAFDGKLEFDVTIIPCKGDNSWVEKTLLEIKDCLVNDKPPKSKNDCSYCRYRSEAGKAIRGAILDNKEDKPQETEKAKGTLF